LLLLSLVLFLIGDLGDCSLQDVEDDEVETDNRDDESLTVSFAVIVACNLTLCYFLIFPNLSSLFIREKINEL